MCQGKVAAEIFHNFALTKSKREVKLIEQMCVCVFSADNRNVGFFDRLCGFRRVTT